MSWLASPFTVLLGGWESWELCKSLEQYWQREIAFARRERWVARVGWATLVEGEVVEMMGGRSVAVNVAA
jgi:hypothetical protein